MKPTLEERFWAKVHKLPGEEACWIWLGAKTQAGYGLLSRGLGNDGSRLAHRISYELFVGAIPDGEQVLHRCDNPGCIRWSHLFAGTQQQNVDDMDTKGRRVTNVTERMRARAREPKTYIQGTKHFKAKLTEAQVLEIRQRYADGDTIIKMAAEFGMGAGSITPIVRGQTWQHIGGPVFPQKRFRQIRGTSHGNAKLDEDKVREARRRYDAGERIAEIAELLGISRPVISTVVKRTAWKHVT